MILAYSLYGTEITHTHTPPQKKSILPKFKLILVLRWCIVLIYVQCIAIQVNQYQIDINLIFSLSRPYTKYVNVPLSGLHIPI